MMASEMLALIPQGGPAIIIQAEARKLDERLVSAEARPVHPEIYRAAHEDKERFLSDLDKLEIQWRFEVQGKQQYMVLWCEYSNMTREEMFPVYAHWFD
jgi:hypothetical protein